MNTSIDIFQCERQITRFDARRHVTLRGTTSRRYVIAKKQSSKSHIFRISLCKQQTSRKVLPIVF